MMRCLPEECYQKAVFLGDILEEEGTISLIILYPGVNLGKDGVEMVTM